jgi:hypothetical protein
MMVLLAPTLFTDHAVDEADLIEVICHGFAGRHDVVVFPPLDAVVCDWLGQQSSGVRDKCRLALDASLERQSTQPCLSTIKVDVVVMDTWGDTPLLSLDSAKQLLQTPFKVWLENDINDGNFLLRTAKPEVRERLRYALDRNWLLFQHANGITSIPQRADVIGVSPKDRIRTFFLFDSDARLPQCPSRHARSAADKCREKGVPFHCLDRRAIENYIPLSALRRWAYASPPRRETKRRAEHVRVFARLTAVQRHHFNVADGFAGDGDDPQWPRVSIEALYADLSDDDRSRLQQGFGRRIASDVYGGDEMPYKWIVDDGSWEEMEPLLNRILRSL